MNRLLRRGRLMLVHLLAAALAAAGAVPSLAAAGSRQVDVRSTKSPNRLCCCGTKDGRCCGKSCCTANVPKGDERDQPQTLTRLDLKPAALPAPRRTEPRNLSAGTLQRTRDREIRASAVPTLQALEIRINT